MKEIVDRLKERRDKELAKTILEAKEGIYGMRQIRLAESVLDEDSWSSDHNGPYTTYHREDYLNDEGEGPYITEEDGEFIAFLGANDPRGKTFDNLKDAKKYIEQSRSINGANTSEFKWTKRSDRMGINYYLKGARGHYVLDDRRGKGYTAFLGYNDYRGKTFDDLDSAKKYVEDSVRKDRSVDGR